MDRRSERAFEERDRMLLRGDDPPEWNMKCKDCGRQIDENESSFYVGSQNYICEECHTGPFALGDE